MTFAVKTTQSDGSDEAIRARRTPFQVLYKVQQLPERFFVKAQREKLIRRFRGFRREPPRLGFEIAQTLHHIVERRRIRFRFRQADRNSLDLGAQNHLTCTSKPESRNFRNSASTISLVPD